MQANAWLVEDVKHVYQLGTYLRSKADTLRFATRQAAGNAVERKIVQSYVEQELGTVAYFTDDFMGNACFPVFNPIFNVFEPFIKVDEIHFRQLGNIFSGYPEMQGFFLKPVSVAFGTFQCIHETVNPFLNGMGIGNGILVEDKIDDAFKI